MFYYNMKKNTLKGKKLKMKGGGIHKKGGGIHKKGPGIRVNNKTIQFSIDPFNLLLMGIIGFLLYQILQKDLMIDNYVFLNDTDHDNDMIYTEDSNYDPVLKKPYRQNNEMMWTKYLEQRPRIPNINIPTRGMPTDYESVGFLKGESGDLQKLVGRETYRGSNLWNYFTLNNDYNQIPIPLHLDNKDCTDERGCSEIYDNQNVSVGGSSQTATIYNKQPYRYIPQI